MSSTAVVQRLALILTLQLFYFTSVYCQLQTNFNFNNVTSRVVDQLQTNYDLNISSRVPEVINSFQPENIIKVNARRKLYEAIYRATENDTQCDMQLSLFNDGLSKFEEWALKMLDSSSKVPSGILIGNTKDLGVYDECVSVKVEKQGELIRGRHCMYSLSIKPPNSTISISTTLSICVPAVCSAQHVSAILQSVINMTSDYQDFEIGVRNVRCSSVGSKPLETGEIVTIVILSVFLCFLVGCTICDIFIRITSLEPDSIFKQFSKFSFYTNVKRIFDTTVPRGNIPAVQGIRFFSMCWVILGHEYATSLFGATINLVDALAWTSSWNALYILIAPFAVDTFFVLSGFLTSYLFIKEMSKGRIFNPIMYYIHRYIRLTPAFAALIVLSIYLVPRMGSGALWESDMTTQKEMCKRNWWPMLLYVHNHVGDDFMGCLGHTWYLAVDMQLFWISPLILYPLAKKPKIGLYVLGAFIIASVITPAVIVGENGFSAAISGTKDFRKVIDMMQKFYVVSYTRAGPWLLGIYLGYKLTSRTSEPTLNFVALGWIFTVLALAFSFFTYRIFQNKDYKWNAPWEIFYAGFGRHIWAFSICWLIYVSSVGYGSFVGRFLTLPVFIPFGRISYCVYLVHMVVQTMRVSATRTPTYFSDFERLYAFFGDFVVCVIAGLVLSLTFESPFLVLEKMILGESRTVRKRESREILGVAEATIGTDNQAYSNDNSNSYVEKEKSINS